MIDSGDLDAVNYKNGHKNHWRRWVWNRLADMVTPKDAVVLYLPGSTDLDRPEALRRGFKEANLIAVEIDKKVARVLRSQGTTVIVADLIDTLLCWPSHTPLSVVVADFVGGLTDARGSTLQAALGTVPALHGTAMLLNLCRGHDAGKQLNFAKKLSAMAKAHGQSMNFLRFPECENSNKHRGQMFLRTHQMISLLCALKIGCFTSNGLPVIHEMGVNDEVVLRGLMQWVPKSQNEVDIVNGFNAQSVWFPRSYTSNPNSTVKMDSVVFRIANGRVGAVDSDRFDELESGSSGLTTNQSVKQVRSQIAAALALRTQRLRGDLHGLH